MPTLSLYDQVYELLDAHIDDQVDETTRQRIALLVVGIIKAQNASPARVAEALETLGLSHAKAESIERRIRRIENDPELTATLCLHPFARQRLLLGRPQELLLILDPTTQEDRVVMVSVAVWYRGRALPLAWALWPANTPLEGERFWARIETLLDVVVPLLPKGVSVTCLADRAFGTPLFTDLLTARGWHYIVRVQGQTRCQDRKGLERPVQQLIRLRGQRAKLHGRVFKKYRWREASILVYWGRRHKDPLCLVSDWPPLWYLIQVYRRRYPIEATFRDYKSFGWHWEQGQVTDLEHVERLLVGMALATWIALYAGTQVAEELLCRPPTGRRRTVPWEGKRSLFTLGLQRLHNILAGVCRTLLLWELKDWSGPNWQSQIYFHHARAFVLGGKNRV